MKKRNEGDPDQLGGLGDMLPAEVLKMLNELLEQQHRTGHPNNGSKIEFVYVASGGQHVETIQKQIVYTTKQQEVPKVRDTIIEEQFNDETPLSALFRKSHHEELRKRIDSWRPYLIDDDPDIDTVAISNFQFDKDQIYSNKVYRDLCELDALGALQVSLSQLARYLSAHSNLSRSYATLYQQLKYYRSECE